MSGLYRRATKILSWCLLLRATVNYDMTAAFFISVNFIAGCANSVFWVVYFLLKNIALLQCIFELNVLIELSLLLELTFIILFSFKFYLLQNVQICFLTAWQYWLYWSYFMQSFWIALRCAERNLLPIIIIQVKCSKLHVVINL